MVPTRIRVSSIPSLGGIASGVLVAGAFAFMPRAALDSIGSASGLAGAIPAAAPPFGITARLCLALGGGLFVGATAWAALYLLFGPGGVFARSGGVDGMPQVRRADAHPDAPPRRPLSAADLGTPTPPVPVPPPASPVERPLPSDLEQPLADFDPAAIPAAPREPVRPVAPLAAMPVPLAPGERIEAFEISPRHAAETGASSIDALLDRLERGTLRRQGQLRAG